MIRKYLLYAIGEALLIFIGIYLAIWFNKRTEYNLDREQEIEVLEEIRSNLEHDMEEIETELSFFSVFDKSCDLIIQYFENGTAYPDSLNNHFYTISIITHFNPNYSGFSLLQSKGIDIIVNDSLRRIISEHYTSLYDYYGQYNQERIDLWGNDSERLLKNNFQMMLIVDTAGNTVGYELIPIDIDELKKDPSFLANIRFLQYRNRMIKLRANWVKKSIADLQSMIEEELKIR